MIKGVPGANIGLKKNKVVSMCQPMNVLDLALHSQSLTFPIVFYTREPDPPQWASCFLTGLSNASGVRAGQGDLRVGKSKVEIFIWPCQVASSLLLLSNKGQSSPHVVLFQQRFSLEFWKPILPLPPQA